MRIIPKQNSNKIVYFAIVILSLNKIVSRVTHTQRLERAEKQTSKIYSRRIK